MDLPLVELGNATNAFPQIAQTRRLCEADDPWTLIISKQIGQPSRVIFSETTTSCCTSTAIMPALPQGARSVCFPESPAYTSVMPDNRAINFTRGQSIRRVLFGIALAFSYVIDHDPRRNRWDRISATALWIILLFGIISFIPNIRDPADKSSLLSRSVRVASGLALLLRSC